MAKKIDTSYQARMDGMVYALRLVEKEGIEALKKDIEFRGANFVPLEINRETMEEIYGMLAARIIEVDALDLNGEHYARISDYAKLLEEECGIKMDLETILKVQQDTDKTDKRLEEK